MDQQTHSSQFKQHVTERLRNISKALDECQPEVWVQEAAALRQAFLEGGKECGRLPARCSQMERLTSRDERTVAELIFEGIAQEFAALQIESGFGGAG